MPAAPASSKRRTVRSTFSASPKPVSASQSRGSDVARVRVRACSTNSVSDSRPTSGTARDADNAAPERYTALNPKRSAMRATRALKTPGTWIGPADQPSRSRRPGEAFEGVVMAGLHWQGRVVQSPAAVYDGPVSGARSLRRRLYAESECPAAPRSRSSVGERNSLRALRRPGRVHVVRDPGAFRRRPEPDRGAEDGR